MTYDLRHPSIHPSARGCRGCLIYVSVIIIIVEKLFFIYNSMLTSMIPRFISVNRIDKRYLTILPTVKNVMGGCVAIVEKNFDFMNIHGPTAEEVVKDLDLTDKTCLITGANSGIGLEMTRCLNAQNCSVLTACRNIYEASSVIRNVCENQDNLYFIETNLASFKSVKNASDEILKLVKNIDIVILNAGVFGLPWTITEDGLETTFQVNYLSQYYLLTNIEKILAPDARIVFSSSESHRNIKWSLNNVLSPTVDMLSLPKEEYTSIKAYNISKLCGILAMHYLGYRWMNTAKQVFCAHPGSFVKTKLCRNWWVYEALYNAMIPFSKSVRQAASTPLYCATSPKLKGLSTMYIKDCQIRDESDLAKDFHLAFRLQDLSYDILHERIRMDEGQASKAAEFHESAKEPLDDTFANYST